MRRQSETDGSKSRPVASSLSEARTRIRVMFGWRMLPRRGHPAWPRQCPHASGAVLDGGPGAAVRIDGPMDSRADGVAAERAAVRGRAAASRRGRGRTRARVRDERVWRHRQHAHGGGGTGGGWNPGRAFPRTDRVRPRRRAWARKRGGQAGQAGGRATRDRRSRLTRAILCLS